MAYALPCMQMPRASTWKGPRKMAAKYFERITLANQSLDNQ